MKFDLAKINLTPEREERIRELLIGDAAEIARLCGVKTALEIVNAFGGTWLRVPQHHALLLDIRNEHIRADYDAGGATGDSLARKYGLSDRQIWDILGKPPTEPDILPLFAALKKE